MLRAAVLALLLISPAAAWVESVEFPWQSYPPQLWERELAWLKNVGIEHVSLPPAREAGPSAAGELESGPSTAAELGDAIRIVRALGMEADLEGPVPEAMRPLTREHGGPLTGPLPGPRLSLLAQGGALTRARELLESGAPSLIWTDVEDTLGPSGYKAGAVNFAGKEQPATVPLRRNAQLAAFWSHNFSGLKETPGAGPRNGTLPAGVTARQFTGESGLSVVSVINRTASAWTGDLKVLYPAAKRVIGIPGVTVPAHDALWLPVNVPLLPGSAIGDRLVYATAELTGIEYENGILALEFSAPVAGEAILQLSEEPYGPLVAGGNPASFDWDDREHRARLRFPAGSGPANHVRIGLAIEPPDATAFFPDAHVLVIGETNRLTAEYSSEAIAQRSRVRNSPGLTVARAPAGDRSPDPPGGAPVSDAPLTMAFDVKVPGTAIHGDHADLAIEADGIQLSHVRPRLLRPASLAFPDRIEVHLAPDSALPLYPATIPVSQNGGRDITVTIRNNAPAIRNFTLELTAQGLDFSPAKREVSVGASTAREVSFHVFASDAAGGVRAGEAKLSGAASWTAALRFVVIPRNGAVAFASDGFSLLEGAKSRAVFYAGTPAGRWLEFIAGDNGRNALRPGGVPFIPGPIQPDGDGLTFATGRTLRLEDLELLAPTRATRSR